MILLRELIEVLPEDKEVLYIDTRDDHEKRLSFEDAMNEFEDSNATVEMIDHTAEMLIIYYV